MNRDDVPKRYRKVYDRAIQGKCSPRTAIRLHCLMCMGWQAKEVPQCTAPSCPLFQFRVRPQKPVTKSSGGALRCAPSGVGQRDGL